MGDAIGFLAGAVGAQSPEASQGIAAEASEIGHSMARKPGDPDLSDLRRMAGLGLEFVSSIAGGILLGWLLDRWLGTAPWFLVAGMGVGLVGGLSNFIKEAMRASRKAERASRREHD